MIVDPSAISSTFLALLRRPEWQKDAACIERPDVSFFPPRGPSPVEAIAVCSRCLVRAECLRYALANDVRFGVWGGATVVQRENMLRAAGRRR